MGITANSGPYLAYGLSQTSSGAITEYNEERAPSLFDLGQATLDPRSYFNYDPGSAVGTQIKGFYDQTALVDYTPYAINSSAISGSSVTVPVAGVALTLTPLASFGAIQTTIVAPESGQTVSVIAIDSTASVLTFGSGGTVALWNPSAGTGRVISLTKASTDATALTYTVNGRDMYGIKMSETITASTQSSVGVGKKAFKYISSIIPATTTINSTGVGVGFIDTFGFPIYTPYAGLTSVTISSAPNNPASIPLLAANFTAASTVATQTSTTPDVRGTYASSIATSGTSTTLIGALSTAIRITIMQNLTAVMMSNVTAGTNSTAVFGGAQYSAV
jgi:hypothetical protein